MGMSNSRLMNSRFTIHNSQVAKRLVSLCIVHRALCIGLLCIVHCALCMVPAFGQHAEYKDRNTGDTVVINKSTYIIHKARKGENLFTIAAHYHVSVNDMEKANKEVSGDIKKNT